MYQKRSICLDQRYGPKHTGSYFIKDLIYDLRKNVFARLVMVVGNLYVTIAMELVPKLAKNVLSKS